MFDLFISFKCCDTQVSKKLAVYLSILLVIRIMHLSQNQALETSTYFDTYVSINLYIWGNNECYKCMIPHIHQKV